MHPLRKYHTGVNIGLPIEKGLHTNLKALAEREKRSLNKQIAYILERAVKENCGKEEQTIAGH